MAERISSDELSLVSQWLDVKQVNILHLDYQEAIRKTILTTWTLVDDFKAELEAVDLKKKAFTPDLLSRFFFALMHQKKQIDTSKCEWFIELNQQVDIRAIDPIGSLADDYFLRLDELFEHGAQYRVPSYNSSVVVETTTKIRQALALLMPIKATYVDSKLLQSISIFAGNEEAATSGVLGVAPGRIYIREVTESYPEFYYLDMMMHEISHLYFNIIATFHPLISDYNKHFFSVAKNTERPIYGIYNATFVLYRLITLYPLVESFLRHREAVLPMGASPEDYLYSRFFHIPFNYEFRLILYRMKFHTACEQMLLSNALTPLGSAFLLAMKDRI